MSLFGAFWFSTISIGYIIAVRITTINLMWWSNWKCFSLTCFTKMYVNCGYINLHSCWWCILYLFFTQFFRIVEANNGPFVLFSYQDKPEPPPEGRLPDATKGQWSGFVMWINLYDWLYLFVSGFDSWLLQVLTIWGMCLERLWGLVIRTLLLYLVVTPLYVITLSSFLLLL